MKQQKDTVIVWPAYLDSTLTKSQGRRIPSNLAAPNITIKMLQEAATKASLESELKSDKVYPRNQLGENKGYLIIRNPQHHKKKRILLTLAKGVRRIVAQRASERLAAGKKGMKKKRKRR